MYTIIGADQREYGPVTAEQIRHWIVEGRANGATLAKAEGAAEFAPLASFPEFADDLRSAAPTPVTPPLPSDAESVAANLREGDYQIDIGSCLSRSWALFQANAGLLIGAAVIFLIVVVVINQLLALLTRSSVESLMAGNVGIGPILVVVLANIPEMAVTMVLTGGFYALLLRLIRGQPAGIGVLFSGFGPSFAPLAVAGIVVQLLTMLGLLACIAPGVYLSVAWIYTAPLIIDRGLGFWPAMELSRKVVTQHWWLVFCLVLVVGLIGLAGAAACCVGLLVALPLGFGALTYAYEDIFRGTASRPSRPF